MIRALAENEVKGKLWIIEPGRIRIHEPFEETLKLKQVEAKLLHDKKNE